MRFRFATNVWYRPASFLAAVAVLTAVRLGHLSLNQWDLMFDEAQYWLWSLNPDWGYYSKPPLIAWAIWSTTHLCGHTESCVRLASPVAHAIASIGVYCCARLLFAPRVPAPAGTGLMNAVYPRQQPDSEDVPPETRADRIAFWSGLLYATAPGVSFSSTLISTDPFLLLFWAWSLYFFVYAIHQPEQDARRFWVLAGVATGLGILSKYAMLLFIPSAILCLVLLPGGLSRIRSFGFWLYVTIALVFLIPNVLWNLSHGFVTISHTWGNAGLRGPLMNPHKMLEFLVGQLGVFGPIVFIIFIGILFTRPWATRGDQRYLILFSFSFPYLFLYLTLSLISRAHANWSAPVYIAGAIMVAAWLMETRARTRWLVAALAVNTALMGFLVTYPASVKLIGVQPAKSNDLFFRQRGQRTYSEAVGALWNDYPETLLLADTRYIVAPLTYYLYRELGPVEVFKWNPDGKPNDHYELITDMTRHLGADFLLVTEQEDIGAIKSHFVSSKLVRELPIPIYSDSYRKYYVYLLTGFKGYE